MAASYRVVLVAIGKDYGGVSSHRHLRVQAPDPLREVKRVESPGMADYHEAFWVVAGTAEPVLALAYSVTFGRYYALGQIAQEEEKSAVFEERVTRILMIATGIAITLASGLLFVSFFITLGNLLRAKESGSTFVEVALLVSMILLPVPVVVYTLIENVFTKNGKHARSDTLRTEES